MRVWLVAFALLLPVVYGIQVNEIMYDVNGTDTGHEWIEIFNNGSSNVNVTELKLFEGGSNHAISMIRGSDILAPSGFAVIADNTDVFLSDHPGYSGRLFDSSFSLSNSGETIAIRRQDFVVENITYISSWGGNGNGNSLCRFPQGNTTFDECSPTPGLTNYVFSDTEAPVVYITSHSSGSIVSDVITIIAVATDNTGVASVQFKVDNTNLGSEISSPPYSIQWDTTSSADGVHTLKAVAIDGSGNTATGVASVTVDNIPDIDPDACDISIGIVTHNDTFNYNDTINFDLFLNDTLCNNVRHNVTVEYFIDDSYGNVVKSLLNTTRELTCSSTINRQWTPGNTTLSGSYYIRTNITNSGCNDVNFLNNNASKALFVIGLPEDIQPPYISNITPSGNLSAGTTALNLSLNTNEAATCRYSEAPSIPYVQMTRNFSTVDGLYHMALVDNLLDGNSYNYYAKCSDYYNNTVLNDSIISFSIELLNQTNQTIVNRTDTYCDMSISIESESEFYSLDTINFDLVLNDTLCSGNTTLHNSTLEYLVEDVFGSPVKPLLNTTKEMTCFSRIGRQWTPGNVIGSEVYYIKASVVSPGCNDTVSQNNNASKMIIIRGNSSNLTNTSFIKVKSVGVGSDGKIKYGESANIELEVYRGNTGKYAIEIWVQDGSGRKLSDISTVHANSKFTTYNLQVPVQMKTNCDTSFSNGVHSVVVEGLDTNHTANITVEGILSSSCRTTSPPSSGGSTGGGGSSTTSAPIVQPYEIVNYSIRVESNKEFSTIVKINNTFSRSRNYTIYSYVFSGTTPISIGLGVDNKWKATYNANSRIIEIGPSKSSTLTLKNKIEAGAQPGVYSLRVRIRADNKDTDITKEIVVIETPKEPIKPAEINDKPKSNVTNTTVSKNLTHESQVTLNVTVQDNYTGNAFTGLFVGNSSELKIMFSSPIMLFFERIFGLRLL